MNLHLGATERRVKLGVSSVQFSSRIYVSRSLLIKIMMVALMRSRLTA